VIALTVRGKPEPRGSKIPVTVYKDVVDPATGKVVYDVDGRPFRTPKKTASGRPMQYVRDDNPNSTPWMQKITREAKAKFAGMDPLAGPLELKLRFYLERPGYHFGTGKNAGLLKARYSDAMHTVRPDRLKLARAVEDALTGVLYVDDAQTVTGPVEKFYCPLGTQPCVEIEIVPLDVPAEPVQAEMFRPPTTF
jgi:Holliday junction resolvase RusA-like endonuclease